MDCVRVGWRVVGTDHVVGPVSECFWGEAEHAEENRCGGDDDDS